ncbi:nitric oxide reductase activation protein NorD [Bacterioplanoides pacificum]|uniref:Nitric oxide reductase activation protein NorD n=1 Tax=Bacterioplanoides pacificum TaxID=1171596 RepID=A0ABV7VVX6_9GAMM
MEEAVGIRWHHFITRMAVRTYPQASACFAEQQASLATVFRALSGNAGLRLALAAEQRLKTSRSWVQKVAGSGLRQALAWRDESCLYLPERLDFYPDAGLNRDLYLWLAALAACSEPRQHEQQHKAQAQQPHWLLLNQRCVTLCLQRFPGLVSVYRRLAVAEVEQRDQRLTLSQAALPREQTLRQAILQPGSVSYLPAGPGDADPVPLWLYPQTQGPALSRTDDVAATAADHPAAQPKANIRRRATLTEDPDGRDGLMVFRLESLLSWSEFIPLDRTADDNDDEDDSLRIAEDLDVITLSQQRSRQASKIRLDLDLPCAAEDDIPLSDGRLFAEWDYRKQRLLPDYCRVIPMLPRAVAATGLPAALQPVARRLRQQFASFNTQPQLMRHQLQGTQLDIDALIAQQARQQQGNGDSLAPVWRQPQRNQRDLACLLLADLSLSTDAWANNDKQVIDVIRDSLHLMGEALDASHDQFAMYGFSSRRRDHVRINMVKNFNEPWGQQIHGRIKALTPGYYTRMGAAIRQANEILQDQPAEQRLLLILTDGKPNDLDLYEGQYGLEDTRMAIIEAHRKGITTHCVTIDQDCQDYVPYVFGHLGYFRIERADQLPRMLPRLYLNLTGLNS